MQTFIVADVFEFFKDILEIGIIFEANLIAEVLQESLLRETKFETWIVLQYVLEIFLGELARGLFALHAFEKSFKLSIGELSREQHIELAENIHNGRFGDLR